MTCLMTASSVDSLTTCLMRWAVEIRPTREAHGVNRMAGSRLLHVATRVPTYPIRRPSQVGAFPIHAIGVANTPQALSLSERLFFSKPKLLTQASPPTSSPAPAARHSKARARAAPLIALHCTPLHSIALQSSSSRCALRLACPRLRGGAGAAHSGVPLQRPI